MRQTPTPRPTGPAAVPRATPAVAATAPTRVLAPPLAGVRVLQNRRAPAQLSLFQRALPGR